MKTRFITMAVSALLLAAGQAHAASDYSFWKEQAPSNVSKAIGTIKVGNGSASWFLQEIVKSNFPGSGQDTAASTSVETLMVSHNGSKNWFFRAIAPNRYSPSSDAQPAQRVAGK